MGELEVAFRLDRMKARLWLSPVWLRLVTFPNLSFTIAGMKTGSLLCTRWSFFLTSPHVHRRATAKRVSALSTRESIVERLKYLFRFTNCRWCSVNCVISNETDKKWQCHSAIFGVWSHSLDTKSIWIVNNFFFVEASKVVNVTTVRHPLPSFSLKRSSMTFGGLVNVNEIEEMLWDRFDGRSVAQLNWHFVFSKARKRTRSNICFFFK